MADRRVHAVLENGTEIVRYERAGKWYAEHDGGRDRLAIRDAARRAAHAATHTRGLPGGSFFDQLVDEYRNESVESTEPVPTMVGGPKPMSIAESDLEILDQYDPPEVKRGPGSKYEQYFVPGSAVALRRGRDHGFVARDGSDRTARQVANSLKTSAKNAGIDASVYVEDEDTVVIVTHADDE